MHRRSELIKEGAGSVLVKWFSFFPFLVLLGCGGDNRAAVFPVTGTITVEGTPAEGVIVTFAVPGKTLMSTGKTDAAGKFRLTTYRANDGALEGENVVTVQIGPKPPLDPKTTSDPTADPTKMLEMSRTMSKMAQGQNLETQKKANATPTSALESSLIPVRYSDAKKTDLRANVEKGKNNKFEFDLKK